MHGLNGDILVWNPVTRRRHELSSMGIRVNAETLRKQLAATGQLDLLKRKGHVPRRQTAQELAIRIFRGRDRFARLPQKYPYHQAILRNEIPLSIGGGIRQSRTLMLLLRKAHLGEVSVSVWPKILKEMCTRKNIHVLE